MKRGRVWPAVALLTAIGLAGCSRPAVVRSVEPPSTARANGLSGPLTEQGMAAIVTATMATNNRANRSIDLSLLRSYEAGSALSIDAASYAESAKAATGACSYQPFGMRVLEAVSLGTGAYPRRFVTLGSSYPLPLPKGCRATSNPCAHADSLFEFEQSAPAAPWKIVLEPSADAGRILELEAHGSRAAPLSSAEASAARRLPAATASALESYEATGRLGPLRSSDFDSSCWLLPDPREAFEGYAKSDLSSEQVYSPGSDEVSVAISRGRALALFSLGFVTTLAPTGSGASIAWTSDPSADPESALLPSGQYARIVEYGSVELAAETEKGGGFSIIGAYAGVTSMKGTAGSTPGTSTPGGTILASDVAR